MPECQEQDKPKASPKKDSTKKKLALTFYIDPELKLRLEAYVGTNFGGRSHHIRTALEMYLDGNREEMEERITNLEYQMRNLDTWSDLDAWSNLE